MIFTNLQFFNDIKASNLNKVTVFQLNYINGDCFHRFFVHLDTSQISNSILT
ncbi:hypothetical protein IMSAGC006_00008 [Muribaculaceae bacterium]|nr:hypothetical protein IMSAGC006_00008 [Muribaculaceae bacterium]